LNEGFGPLLIGGDPVANTDPQVMKQKEIGGIDVYHTMGYKGQDYGVMHLESSKTPHGLGVTEDILDIVPECKVYRTGSLILSNNETVKQADCFYEGKTYTIEEFIRERKIKIVTKSVGGPENDPAREKYWQDLIDKYNIILVSPAGNNKFTIAFPAKVCIVVGAVGRSDKGIINPKSYTGKDNEVDFAYFTGDQEGTSFAAPRLVGVILLLLSRFGDKTQGEIYEMLKVLAKDVDVSGLDVKTGWGIPILHADDDRRLGKLVEQTATETTDMVSPYIGKFKVTQKFKGKDHKGLDLVGITSKDIFSTVDGIVESARRDTDPNNPNNTKYGMGNYVRIKDAAGNRYYFAHLSRISVKTGQTVKKGEKIGVEGSTGNSTGSHLHYEVRSEPDNTKFLDVSKLSGIPNALGIYGGDPTSSDEAKKTVKEKAGLSDETVEYLVAYKYGNDLINKLAKAMIGGNK
jgi:murein DD-endopeptidase MepM/ murein hydrolase activator NlpD